MDIPEDIELKIELDKIKVKGPKGEIERTFPMQKIGIKKEDRKVIISSEGKQASFKAIVFAFRAHIKNMLQGAKENYIYKLKICASHFPINVKIEGNQLSILNFLGEKKPRTTNFSPLASVKVEGDIIIVESPDKEIAGQTASNIEQITRVRGRDRRIFSDGIFMTEKAGKKI